MSSTINVVAVLPDGKEHFAVVVDSNRAIGGYRSYEQVAEEAVRAGGLTTTRDDPKAVVVKIFKLEIEKGELKRKVLGAFTVTPPLERMTEEQYDRDLAAVLKELPEEFRSFVSTQAWDEGHSAGYEEVVSIADNLVSGLKVAVDAYTTRMMWE